MKQQFPEGWDEARVRDVIEYYDNQTEEEIAAEIEAAPLESDGQGKTVKERMVEIIAEQPDDSSFEEILRELVFARMIERGVADADAGRTISHEEVRRRIASWADRPRPPAKG